MVISDGRFRTADTPLAAFLSYKKHELLGIELEDGRGFFVFKDSKALQDCCYEFHSSDYADYYRTYRTMLNLLNMEMRARNGRGTTNNHD